MPDTRLPDDIDAVVNNIPAVPHGLPELRLQLGSLPPLSPSYLPGTMPAELPPSDGTAASSGSGTGAAVGTLTSDFAGISGSAILPRSLPVTAFADTIRPVAILTALPTLPHANYPVGSFVYKTTDVPPRLYKNVADAWVAAVGPNDIEADSITAGQIAVGAIGASEIAAGAITVGKLADGTGSNFAPNPSFELVNGVASDVDGVVVFGWGSTGASFARFSSTRAKYGVLSLRLSHVADTSEKEVFSDYIQVTPGRRVTIKAWVAGETGNNAAAVAQIGLVQYTQAGATGTASVSNNTVGATTTFVADDFSGGIVLDATTAKVRIRLRLASGGSVGDDVYFDGIELLYLDDDINHAGGNVLIDSTGILIQNGKLTFKDNYGATALDGGGFGGVWQRFLANGLFNGDFFAPASTLSSELHNTTNPLPWWGYARASGTACTAQVVSDASTASGYAVRLDLASGAAGDDCYVEQMVPIAGNRGQSFAYHLAATFKRTADTSAVGTVKAYLKAQHFKKDGSTTTGSEVTWTGAISNWTIDEINDLVTYGTTLAPPPADAYFVRIRVGLKRDTAATSATATLYLYEVRVQRGPQITVIGDSDGATSPATLEADAGFLKIQPLGKSLGSIRLSEAGGAFFHGDTINFEFVGNNGGLTIDPVGLISVYRDNTFDTYTPTITGGGTASYTTRNGYYQKIGKMVYLGIEIVINSAGSGGGAIEIALPSTAYAGRFVLGGRSNGFTTFTDGPVAGYIGSGATTITPMEDNDGTNLDRSHFANGALLVLTGFYFEA